MPDEPVVFTGSRVRAIAATVPVLLPAYATAPLAWWLISGEPPTAGIGSGLYGVLTMALAVRGTFGTPWRV
ncbi:hypothetical protein ACNTMW_06915 [Planosporangium sp. 12N6]|uniref:hypothetical protein n=1 Tax=Planosporangium spinosum TaxID=3402278 RepID=UPI003CF622A9